MKKIVNIFIATFFLVIAVNAQKPISEITFDVAKYDIRQVGYPSNIVPDGYGNFCYVEFWKPHEAYKRRYIGPYLQCVEPKTNQYAEVWFRPAFVLPGQTVFYDLYKTKSHLVTIGEEADQKGKNNKNVAKFFSDKGKEITANISISNYGKTIPSGYNYAVSTSPDSTKLLWFGKPIKTSTSAKYYFSVLSEKGTKIWDVADLSIPLEDNKFFVQDAKIDDKGNLLLLMMKKISNSPTDSMIKPMVMKYDFMEKKFKTYTLNFANKAVMQAEMKLTKDEKVYITGVLSNFKNTGFMNGQKFQDKASAWDEIFYIKLKNDRDLKEESKKIQEMPEILQKTYKNIGGNFARFRVEINSGQLYWIAEEYYTQKEAKNLKVLLYDIAILKWDTEKDKLAWASRIDKKQRNYTEGSFLSYTLGITKDYLHFVYLNEMGSEGSIVASSVNRQSGVVNEKKLISNKNTQYHFFPARSAMVSANTMILLGAADVNGNNYKLIRIDLN